MPNPISMGQLAADLEALQKQFENYKREVEKAFVQNDDRIKKLEAEKKK